MKIKIMTPILCSALLTQLVVLPELLYSQSDFYRGKTIRMVHGRDAGGSGDLRVKALVPFLQKYIPGNPSIVHEFMPEGRQLYFRLGGARWIDHRQRRQRHGVERGSRRNGSAIRYR